MRNIAILDDVIEEAQQTKKLLLPYFENRELEIGRIDIFQNGTALLTSLNTYDILFLDIEVGDENGIEIAKQVRKRMPEIVIIVTTSYVKYSMEGYKIQVARYLLKPLHAPLLYSELDELLAHDYDRYIVISQKKESYRLAIKDLYYVESYGRLSRAFTKKGCYECKHSIGWWEEQLQAYPFKECYKGIIVHIRYIEHIGKDVVTLENKQQLPLARRRHDCIRNAWLKEQEQSI